jgi:uncharacterized protein (TIGR01777 family)
MTKRVAIAGSSGLIGGALRRHLRDRGDDVVRLVRRPAAAPDEVRWDPESGRLPLGALDGVDAIVNLAGVGIGDRRWTPAHKRAVERSRVDSTGTIARALAAVKAGTGRGIRFVNASAVGIYGDRGDEVLTETTDPGDDFLAQVVCRWEAATQPAVEAGVPVALVRSGLVVASSGGAFAPLLLATKLGLGGPLGSGRQWWPWITLVDEVRAIAYLVDRPDLSGAFNAAAPDGRRQVELARALASAMHRPALVPVPRLALRVVIGEFGDRILDSQRVQPRRLLESGFDFEHPDLDSGVSWVVAQ